MWTRSRSGNGKRYACFKCGGTLTVAVLSGGSVVKARTPCLTFRKGEGWTEWRTVTTTRDLRFQSHGTANGLLLFDCGDGWLIKVKPSLVSAGKAPRKHRTTAATS